MLLLSLVGEQPIPILLVNRFLNPEQHLLAHSSKTERVAANLQSLLPNVKLLKLEDAYHLEQIRKHFESVYQPNLVFDLTGGTKPMAWAGYQVAYTHKAQIVYLVSEGKQSKLVQFNFAPSGIEQTAEVLPTLITIDDYLMAHGIKAEANLVASSNQQEVALKHFFEAHTDECQHNIKFPAFEVDFLIRRANQVAVVEAKSGKIKRFGIDQLTTITGREYLGTYTGRIWIVQQKPGAQLQELANAYQIDIVLISITQHSTGRWRLTKESQTRLQEVLERVLGPKTIEREGRNHPNPFSQT